MTTKNRRAALAALLGGLWLRVRAAEVAGVRLDDAIQVRGEPLVLNGAGVRFRGPFQVYAAGLYLRRKTGSAEEALALPGAKRLAITLLREIDAQELGKLFTRGVEDNAPKTEMSRLIPGLIQLGLLFAEQKKLRTGDSIAIEWQPGTGTLISIEGRQRGEPIREPEFFGALLRIWLGPQPADARLKKALLGEPQFATKSE